MDSTKNPRKTAAKFVKNGNENQFLKIPKKPTQKSPKICNLPLKTKHR